MRRRASKNETAELLGGDIPPAPADDQFVEVLAATATASVPTTASTTTRVGGRGLRIVAVLATLAMTSVGAAYAADRISGHQLQPPPVRTQPHSAQVGGGSADRNDGRASSRADEPNTHQ